MLVKVTISHFTFENRDTEIIPNLILPSAESNAVNAQVEALLNDLGMNESL